MSKKEKKSKKEITEAEKITSERLEAIRHFNMDNFGVMWIDPERVPTEDEINEAKKMFEERTEKLNKKDDYLIADKANAMRVIAFLKNFISNAFWGGRYFVGVIRFVNEFIPEFVESFEKEEKDLTMDFGAMQFTFQMLSNYGGIGLDSAIKMADMWDEYLPIYEVLRDHIEWYKKEDEICKKLQNRWGMLEQGYFLLYLDEDADAVNGEANKTDNDSIKPIEEYMEENKEENKESNVSE